MRQEIGEVMREIFNSPTLEIAQEMKRRAVEKYHKRAPEFAKWLEESASQAHEGVRNELNLLCMKLYRR